MPFAVVGSNRVIEGGGKKIRGRQYPWGIVEGRGVHSKCCYKLGNFDSWSGTCNYY